MRIMENVEDIEKLKKEFEEGIDINEMKEQEMLGVKVEGMKQEVRRREKEINLGII